MAKQKGKAQTASMWDSRRDTGLIILHGRTDRADTVLGDMDVPFPINGLPNKYNKQLTCVSLGLFWGKSSRYFVKVARKAEAPPPTYCSEQGGHCIELHAQQACHC